MKYKVEKSENAFAIKEGNNRVIGVPDYSDALMIASTLEMETAPLHAEIARLKAQNAKLIAFVKDMRPMFINLEDVKCIYFGFGEKPTPYITPLRPNRMLECWNEVRQTIEDEQESETDNEA